MLGAKSLSNIVEGNITTKVSAVMQNYVFVVDTNRTPLDPCHPATARKLLRDGKAAVYKRFPFTIILKCAVEMKA